MVKGSLYSHFFLLAVKFTLLDLLTTTSASLLGDSNTSFIEVDFSKQVI